jgi:hypothetical protein
MRHLCELSRPRSIYLFGLIIMLLFATGSAIAYQTEYVVVVLIDGVRYTEGLGSAYCPRLNALGAQAVIQDSAFNDSITVTASAVPASWMGRFYTLQDTTYLGNDIQFCRYPTYWEYARKDLGYTASQVVYITPDYGSSTWMPSFYPGYGPNYWPQFIQPTPSTGENNIACFDSAVTVIRRQHPKVMYVYFPDTDHAGHLGIWNDYLGKIREADSLTKALWDSVQTDAVMANKTTMFITNDHGRHTTNFTGHGDSCFGCRHVMMFAIGPDFKQNEHVNSPRARMTDITKTAGELLGYTSPYSTGRVMTELFDESGPSCPGYLPGDINSDSSVLGGDVTYGVRYFKGLGAPPPDSCFIDSLDTYLYICGDVNGNCEFRGSDITRLIAYFKSMADLDYCHWALPVPPLRVNSPKGNSKR